MTSAKNYLKGNFVMKQKATVDSNIVLNLQENVLFLLVHIHYGGSFEHITKVFTRRVELPQSRCYFTIFIVFKNKE